MSRVVRKGQYDCLLLRVVKVIGVRRTRKDVDTTIYMVSAYCDLMELSYANRSKLGQRCGEYMQRSGEAGPIKPAVSSRRTMMTNSLIKEKIELCLGFGMMGLLLWGMRSRRSEDVSWDWVHVDTPNRLESAESNR